MGLLSCLVKNDSLASNGAADGVVPVHVAHSCAALGGALSLLPEDREAKPILGSEQELPGSQVQAQGFTVENCEPLPCHAIEPGSLLN